MWNRWKNVWRDTRMYFWAGMALLAGSAAAGYLWPEAVESIVQDMLNRIRELAEQVRERGTSGALFWVIFTNNALAALLMMVLGVFFAVFPLFSIFSNGLLLGYMLEQMNSAGINPLQMFVVGILPHGILELPAVVFAAAMGWRYGVLAIRALGGMWRPDRRDELREAWKKGIRQFPVAAFTVLMLLLAAALVESFVTPVLIQTVVGVNGV